MSTDEQYLAIGKMTTERAECRRQEALLRHEIRDRGLDLSRIGSILSREPSTLGEYETVLAMIKELQSGGGFERMLDAITEYIQQHRRVADLTESLHKAGAE